MKHVAIICAAILLLGILFGCKNGSNPALISPSHVVTSEVSDTSNISQAEFQPDLKEIYQAKLPENVLDLAWLNETKIYWINQTQGTDAITYRLYIADVDKKTEDLVFERSIPASNNLNISVNLMGNQLFLYLNNNSDNPIYSKVTLSATDWTILSEEPLNISGHILWDYKSSQNIIVGYDENQKITLYPLESPERCYPLCEFQDTRYDIASEGWSPSGEYFILANNDALGMERFESLADLIAYPKGEWPTARQYDVFSKDGNYAFSFAVDFTHREDGSYTGSDVFWMPGDEIYVASTFYDTSRDTKQSQVRVINSSGTVVYENRYMGETKRFSPINLVKRGFYYTEKQDNAVHLMKFSFLTGEDSDYGLIAEGDDSWLSLQISPEESLALVHNRQDGIIRVLDVKK